MGQAATPTLLEGMCAAGAGAAEIDGGDGGNGGDGVNDAGEKAGFILRH